MSPAAESRRAPPIAITIAGSDSSVGAGIEADLKTFTALGVYGAAAITALTAQNTTGVQAVEVVSPAFVLSQIESVVSDLAVGATKTGMLADRAMVETIADAIRRYNLAPLVVDPVMVATSGDVLLAPDAVDAVRRLLLPLADVVTPNLAEAARLLDEGMAESEAAQEAQARRLLAIGARAALVKGGHGAGDEAVDILATATSTVRFAKPRIATRNTHGTGCTLSAAIAAYLARGAAMEDAIREAKQFTWAAIVAAKDQTIGHGAGPVDHLHAIGKP